MEKLKELFITKKDLGDDFVYAISANEILQEIVSTAQNINDAADFGVNVASVLERYGLIDKAVYEIIAGEI
ncbi:hypothetical protein SAMN05428976_10255 [Clostridium sp. USBA 49]|uniref:hypothetical protein n=1 Tax=Clostridium sp. USBA 49 TaxID=1881060 RepID=UPI000999AC6C|nr:hypothetical protein [Clostridium sp. USBA 49]SKA75089.1 hypothetical protein SAMN05428976_10255 [Clostridium sp. USBA 49]